VGLLLVIPGLVLLLNQVNWFEGENQVGTILVVVGGILIALQVIWALMAAAAANKVRKDITRRHGSFFDGF